MPVFSYKGVDGRGKAIAGTKDADTPKMLRALLRREGVLVTQVTEARGGAGSSAAGEGLSRQVGLGILSRARVRRVEVVAFTRQLATLLKAGIPLAEALGAIFEQLEHPRMKAVVGDVRIKVNEGSSLADALSRHRPVFEETYISMIRAGETAGNLDQVLMRLAELMEAQGRLKSKVLGAMIYPVIIVILSCVLMAVLMVLVVPKVTQIYQDSGKTLPWNTQLLIFVSGSLAGYWYAWVAAVAVLLGGFGAWKRSSSGRVAWDALTLRLPIAGQLARQLAIGRFARTLGTMLAAGVPLLRAIDIASEILGNRILTRAVTCARDQIQQGESIATTLKRSGEFPPIVTHMIGVGERAGQLEQMLGNVADAFEAEADARLNRLTALLEPLMIVVMGGLVAFIVFSILMPIMDMSPTMGE